MTVVVEIAHQLWLLSNMCPVELHLPFLMDPTEQELSLAYYSWWQNQIQFLQQCVLKNSRYWTLLKVVVFLSVIKFCFRCDEGEKHRVIFYLGEKLVPYDGCNVGLCSWSYIKDKFYNIARDCNLDFCYYDRSGSQKHLPIYWITVAVVTVVTFCRQNFK